MKEEPIYIFLINNKPVEEISGKDIGCHADMVQFKSSLAASRGIDVDDIEVETKYAVLPEYTDTFVRYDGTIMFRLRPHFDPKMLTGVSPMYDLHHEELLNEFLDVLFKKQFDNALGFL